MSTTKYFTFTQFLLCEAHNLSFDPRRHIRQIWDIVQLTLLVPRNCLLDTIKSVVTLTKYVACRKTNVYRVYVNVGMTCVGHFLHCAKNIKAVHRVNQILITWLLTLTVVSSTASCVMSFPMAGDAKCSKQFSFLDAFTVSNHFTWLFFLKRNCKWTMSHWLILWCYFKAGRVHIFPVWMLKIYQNFQC